MRRNADILLLKPPTVREASYPLDLAFLAAPIRRAGYTPVGRDADFGEFRPALMELAAGRFRAVLVSIRAGQREEAVSMIRRVRAVSGDIPVALVGSVPERDPKALLPETGADAVLAGDAEFQVAAFLENPSHDSVHLPGATLRHGTEIETLPLGSSSPDLQDLLPPDRRFLPLLRYGHAYRSVRYPFAAVQGSRGCSRACAHCNRPGRPSHRFRARKPSDIAEEMQRLVRDYGIRDFHFEDDNFFEPTDHLDALLELLAEKRRGWIWEVANGGRPEDLDGRRLSRMAEAGCRRIAIGVEGLFPEGRPSPHPLYQPFETTRKIVRLARKNGISVTGYFLLGLPGVSLEATVHSLRLSRRLGLDMAHYSVFRPENAHESADFRTTDDLPDAAAMRRLAAAAYRRFYLTPMQVSWLVSEVAREPGLVRAMGKKIRTDLFENREKR